MYTILRWMIVCMHAHYNISRGRSHKSARRIIISHYGTYTRIHLLNSSYAIGYNVLFLSTIKSNAKHLTSRTVHLVHWFCPRAHIHRGNHCFLSEYFDESNKDNFSIVDNFKKFLDRCD